MHRLIVVLTTCFVLAGCATHTKTVNMSPTEQAYTQAMQRNWTAAVTDPGTGDWQEHWFLDGLKARVITGDDGMTFHSGPVPDEDASHAVLWTKQAFEGDVKIEYDYTRLDQSGRGVCIIYLLATGSGVDPYAHDITEWSKLREVPGMGKYFRHMNLLHISYAAATYDRETLEPTDNDYVRARRYLPEREHGLKGTNLEPDYHGTGLVRTGVPHRITVVKSGDWLFMEAKNAEQRHLFAWKTDVLPPVTEGRIGFRQMFTRSARDADITISTPKD